MKNLLFTVCLLLVCGCTPEADTPMEKQVPNFDNANFRFQIKRVGVFEDDLAYNSKRGIYLIRDKQTGNEYLGVSGIGISELSSHQSGKLRLSDER